MSFWAVVQTISGHEAAVAERVDRLGYDTLTPKARFRHNGKMRVGAVFPGYFFARIVVGWYDIKWCMGVLRLVGADADREIPPTPLPDVEVEKFQREMGRNGLIKLPKAPPPTDKTPLAIGSEVKILTGSFCGLYAIYQGMSPHEREMVLLDLLGRKVPIELNPEDRIVAVPVAPTTQLRY